MLTCKEATELASTALERKLPFLKRLELRWHLFICHHCRRYFNQLRFLKRAISSLMQRLDQRGRGLSPDARVRIQEKLDRYS